MGTVDTFHSYTFGRRGCSSSCPAPWRWSCRWCCAARCPTRRSRARRPRPSEWSASWWGGVTCGSPGSHKTASAALCRRCRRSHSAGGWPAAGPCWSGSRTYQALSQREGQRLDTELNRKFPHIWVYTWELANVTTLRWMGRSWPTYVLV